MDRQATFLLALGLLIAAAAFVSASGWILFLRDRRADKGGPTAGRVGDPVEPNGAAEQP
jgi:hypothetical protein